MSFRAGMLALAVATAAGSAPARAADEDESDFSIFFEAAPHVVVQTAKGSVGSTFGISSDSSNILTNMNFRLGGGLKGPALEDVWGRPRPVVWAAALVPINESSVIGTQFIETAGAGAERLEFSKYAIEYQTSAIAGIGVELVTPIFDYDITITPGIQSMHLVLRYTGQATLETQSGLNNQSVSLSRKKKITQHLVGPVLRVGTPSAEFQGFLVDFSIDAGLFVDVSGSRREVVASDGVDEARFSFETGTTAVQIGSALRIRWP